MVEKLVIAIKEYVKRLNDNGYDDTFDDVCQRIIEDLDKEEF